MIIFEQDIVGEEQDSMSAASCIITRTSPEQLILAASHKKEAIQDFALKHPQHTASLEYI